MEFVAPGSTALLELSRADPPTGAKESIDDDDDDEKPSPFILGASAFSRASLRLLHTEAGG